MPCELPARRWVPRFVSGRANARRRHGFTAEQRRELRRAEKSSPQSRRGRRDAQRQSIGQSTERCWPPWRPPIARRGLDTSRHRLSSGLYPALFVRSASARYARRQQRGMCHDRQNPRSSQLPPLLRCELRYLRLPRHAGCTTRVARGRRCHERRRPRIVATNRPITPASSVGGVRSRWRNRPTRSRSNVPRAVTRGSRDHRFC
jgi:hypothetical protein